MARKPTSATTTTAAATTGTQQPPAVIVPAAQQAKLKRYDVPVVHETECLYVDVEASCVEEAEHKARIMFERGERPDDRGVTIQGIIEVGPAREMCEPASSSTHPSSPGGAEKPPKKKR